MSKVYSAIGPVLSCVLVLAAPSLARKQAAAGNMPMVMQTPAAMVLQLAQDDSNDSNGDQPSDQPDQSGVDNPGEQSAQPGDDSPQAGPSDNDNGNNNGDDSQMNASPGDSGSDNGDQTNQQQGYESSPQDAGNAQ